MNTAGVNWLTPTAIAFESTKPAGESHCRTTTEALVPATSKGVWKLICPGETKNSGAGIPFTSTLAPPRSVGSGNAAAAAVVETRPVPNKDSTLPGVISSRGARASALAKELMATATDTGAPGGGAAAWKQRFSPPGVAPI